MNFNTDMDAAPWDEFIMLKVDSGMSTTPFDYVYCRRHSDGYRGEDWTTTQNDRLTDSHTGTVYGWARMSEVNLLGAAVNAHNTIEAIYQWKKMVDDAGGATNVHGVAKIHAFLKSMEIEATRIDKLVTQPLIEAIKAHSGES